MSITSIFAAKSYASARPVTEADPKGAGQLAGKVAQDFATTLNAAEQTAQSALVGDADPHALVEALAQSQLAVETAVSVRDKVVEAYQEILRMPV
ncbi:flagellar hook-basal body complex protein FliE [Qingshengfaniella alkalisoli]|uniref:Flagellar hook-basal body complex protein FliE n=1 Tax=Qingshengfaniella alkalisoli TaxID=2599296 RepID=A0A5B8IAA8_9RHOB|nr:flagellar hook-basal body complex protein FliE [Qingshengfaniella alkalisoli]QDY70156.1 flagellar hook-basal body complex protein FliE [Qingshengfaniella alkalisoli]